MRRGIGIVFQAFNLFPHMSVLENVTLGPRKALGLSRSAAAHRADELLARFGLAEKRADYPDRLSGGQQQRVAIVRALAMQPQLLLLDEVTSALDPELVAEVLEVIRELASEGMTMLIATHEMSFARDVAQRVCFLDDGVILEQGPPERIFGAPSEPRTQQFLQRIVDAGRLKPWRTGPPRCQALVSSHLAPSSQRPLIELCTRDAYRWGVIEESRSIDVSSSRSTSSSSSSRSPTRPRPARA